MSGSLVCEKGPRRPSKPGKDPEKSVKFGGGDPPKRSGPDGAPKPGEAPKEYRYMDVSEIVHSIEKSIISDLESEKKSSSTKKETGPVKRPSYSASMCKSVVERMLVANFFMCYIACHLNLSLKFEPFSLVAKMMICHVKKYDGENYANRALETYVYIALHSEEDSDFGIHGMFAALLQDCKAFKKSISQRIKDYSEHCAAPISGSKVSRNGNYSLSSFGAVYRLCKALDNYSHHFQGKGHLEMISTLYGEDAKPDPTGVLFPTVAKVKEIVTSLCVNGDGVPTIMSHFCGSEPGFDLKGFLSKSMTVRLWDTDQETTQPDQSCSTSL